MSKPSPTETRVREALLRLWERAATEDAIFKPQAVAIETTDDGAKRPALSLDGVSRVGRRVAAGEASDCTGDGRWMLSTGAEAAYERGVFRVRKRRTAEDAAESGECVIVHGYADLDSPIHLPDAEPRVTQRHLDMMRHATGRKLDGHRNHYSAVPDTDPYAGWEELVGMGLAERLDVSDGATTYSVTEAGFRMTYGDVRKPREKR
jgi:hypothetical protein